MDIAVHLGTLLAVIAYLRSELVGVTRGLVRWSSGRGSSAESRLGLQLIVASIPAGLGGLLLHSVAQADTRSVPLVAGASIFFALVLWWADARATNSSRVRSMSELSLGAAVFIGFAQAFALIPGASRSGVTLTAGRMLGLDRASAARFSFLLSVPIILATGLLLAIEAGEGRQAVEWSRLAYATGLSALVALLTIHFFMRLLPRVGVLPFVIYRLVFGAILLLWLA